MRSRIVRLIATALACFFLSFFFDASFSSSSSSASASAPGLHAFKNTASSPLTAPTTGDLSASRAAFLLPRQTTGLPVGLSVRRPNKDKAPSLQRPSAPSSSALQASTGPPKPSSDFFDALDARLDQGLGSLLLLSAALLSTSLANLPKTGLVWRAFWALELGPKIGAHALSVQGWVNEALMALFFFYVGLELKKECVEGTLSSPRKALLPCLAALGGMIMPMLIYTLVNLYLLPNGSMQGLTIPIATDIAFAMGVFGLFKRSLPASMEPFLLTLATVDDLGAIAVIALCCGGTLEWRSLLLASSCFALCLCLSSSIKSSSAAATAPTKAARLAMPGAGATAEAEAATAATAANAATTKAMKPPERPEATTAPAAVATSPSIVTNVTRAGRRTSLWGLALLGSLFWYCLKRGGLNADIAGFLVALCLPVRDGLGNEVIEPMLQRWKLFCNLVILPLFALANCAISLRGASAATNLAVPVGVFLGLLVGKPLGICGISLAAVASGIAQMPDGMSKRHLAIIGLLGGIGFTMCLFLIDATLSGAAGETTKLFMLAASCLASLASALMMGLEGRRRGRRRRPFLKNGTILETRPWSQLHLGCWLEFGVVTRNLVPRPARPTQDEKVQRDRHLALSQSFMKLPAWSPGGYMRLDLANHWRSQAL